MSSYSSLLDQVRSHPRLYIIIVDRAYVMWFSFPFFILNQHVSALTVQSEFP